MNILKYFKGRSRAKQLKINALTLLAKSGTLRNGDHAIRHVMSKREMRKLMSPEGRSTV